MLHTLYINCSSHYIPLIVTTVRVLQTNKRDGKEERTAVLLFYLCTSNASLTS